MDWSHASSIPFVKTFVGVLSHLTNSPIHTLPSSTGPAMMALPFTVLSSLSECSSLPRLLPHNSSANTDSLRNPCSRGEKIMEGPMHSKAFPGEAVNPHDEPPLLEGPGSMRVRCVILRGTNVHRMTG